MGNLRLIRECVGTPLAEFSFPCGALGGLQAVFTIHFHQDTVLLQSVENAWKLLTKRSASHDEILTEQVSQVLWFRANT
jgi:hypothetical protein